MPSDDKNIDPEEMMMRANLREFGQRIAMVCALEEGGKVSVEEAYDRIKQVWKRLKHSKKSLIQDPPSIDADFEQWIDGDFPFQDKQDNDNDQ